MVEKMAILRIECFLKHLEVAQGLFTERLM